MDPGGVDRGLLDRLLSCADALPGADPALRARLHCACADARLRAGLGPADVEAAFAQVMRNTGTGRYRQAEGLAAARAARAFAMHGAVDRAIDLWRKSILLASESRLYGDILACRLAINTAALEKPDPGFGELGLSETTSPRPPTAFQDHLDQHGIKRLRSWRAVSQAAAAEIPDRAKFRATAAILAPYSVERLVLADPGKVAGRASPLSSWLIEVREPASDVGRPTGWQRLVDALVVAGVSWLASCSE